MKKVISIFLILSLFISCTMTTKKDLSRKGKFTDLESALQYIADQLFEGTYSASSKVAILDFTGLDGKSSIFGKYIAENLTSTIHKTKKIEIVERRLIGKLIEEQKLSLSGIVDTENAQEIGKITGAAMVISGTYIDLGMSVKINARLISTEKGTILGTSTAELTKDSAIRKLLNENYKLSERKEVKLEENKLVTKILVYVGDVPAGESGRSASGMEVNIGGSFILTAQGRDNNGNWIYVEPTWKPSKPGIIEIIPQTGSRVKVKGLRSGTVDILVEYEGVKSIVEYIFVK